MPPLTRALLAIGGLVSAAALPAPSAQAQDRCLLYEPEVVVLRGTIVRFKAYGEPGYVHVAMSGTLFHEHTGHHPQRFS